MTLGRTVAICGRVCGHSMVAIMLPPKAGRVCSSIPSSSLISRRVQSAVKPASIACGHIRNNRPANSGCPGKNHFGFLLSDHLLQDCGIDVLAKLFQHWVFSKENGIGTGRNQIARIECHCAPRQHQH